MLKVIMEQRSSALTTDELQHTMEKLFSGPLVQQGDAHLTL